MTHYYPFSKHISVLYRHTQSMMGGQLEALGVGMGQYPYILAVCEQPGITQDKLTRRLLLNKSSVARAIAQLEQRGFLRRVTDPADKRSYRLYPTDKGLEARAVIHEKLDGINRKLTDGFSGEEKIQAAHLLEKMADNILGQASYGSKAHKASDAGEREQV